VKIVSLATMLPPDAPVIWRGPMRSKAIEELLDKTDWGEIDVLVLDLPPGTGDEVLTITQRIAPQAAMIVTTPQEVARLDARRAVGFAKKLNVSNIGLVENMSGFSCPHCGERIDLFGAGTIAADALELGVALWGTVPLDPGIPAESDAGRPIAVHRPESEAAEAIAAIAERLSGILGIGS
jgi:Mrp family chromosome partitioning ATPase